MQLLPPPFCPSNADLVRMERLGGEFCPLDGKVEDHAHVLKKCYFPAFTFDTVQKAFGLAQGPGGGVLRAMRALCTKFYRTIPKLHSCA